MNQVAIVYWSGTGNTAEMAKLICEGAKSEGAEVHMFPAVKFSPDVVHTYDAIAFGCPSMGNEELEDSEFEPMFYSVLNKLKSKKIALFGSYGWGDGEWMRNWEETCKSQGAVFACKSVICNDAPDDEAQEACKALGKAIAK